MNTIKKIIVLLLAAFLLTPAIVSAKGGGRPGSNNRQPIVSTLTEGQEATLLWMREEEKLARDVYKTMYVQWKDVIFKNIANSEQNHMDALLKKIDSFGLTDPVSSNAVGSFENEELLNLYNDLIATGNDSYINALLVGVTIEDLDIADLIQAIDETDDLALKTTYENLLEGSKNHLRSFIGLLEAEGGEYSPVYISNNLFEAIIDQ